MKDSIKLRFGMALIWSSGILLGRSFTWVDSVPMWTSFLLGVGLMILLLLGKDLILEAKKSTTITLKVKANTTK